MISITILYAFDLSFWSHLHFFIGFKNANTKIPLSVHKIESFRYDFMKLWATNFDVEHNHFQKLLLTYSQDEVFGALLRYNQSRQIGLGTVFGNFESVPTQFEKSHCKRLLFLGSSQTFGAGASHIFQTFTQQIHRLINSDPAKKCAETFNAAVSGSSLSELQVPWVQLIQNYEPDVVVANLGTNDPADSFKRNLVLLVESFKNKNQLILVQEPIYMHKDVVNKKHIIMRDLAAQYKLTYVPMHDWLRELEKENTGYLWWDQAHLTDYGQRIFTEKLMPIIEENLKSPKVSFKN